MRLYQLTAAQKQLIRCLVAFSQRGQLIEPFGVIPRNNPVTAYTIHLKGRDSFIFEDYGDLDVLCAAGLLRFVWNRSGSGKLFAVTKEGKTAVANAFQSTTTPIGYDIYLPDVLSAMTSGTLDLPELDKVSLSDLIQDIALRRIVVEVISNKLLRFLHAQLGQEDYEDYKSHLEQFANRLLHEPASELEFQQQYRILAFVVLGKLGAATIAQIQPLLYILWLIAVVRLEGTSLL